MKKTKELKRKYVEEALRQFISDEIDYDIHKNLEHDEEDGTDSYPELAKTFMILYHNIVVTHEDNKRT